MLKEYLRALTSLILPRLCLSCQTKIAYGYLCLSCREKISFLKPPLCHSTRIYPQARVISITEYKQPISGLIQLFKYQDCHYLGEFLASLMIEHLSSIGFSANNYDCLVAVPMHQDKLKIRGYNQAELLAKVLSNHFRIPLRNDIIRVLRLRPSQTKLDRLKRQNNLEGIFSATPEVKNLNFLLVDDIFTSGATLAACSRALKEKGARMITGLTLSKTR